MRAAFFASVASIFLIVAPLPATAQDIHPCKADRERFCPDAKPGEGKFWACLKAHEAELSPACAAERKEKHEAWQKVRAACKDDEQKFCPDAAKDHGALKCLNGHAPELSAACGEALKTMPGAQKAAKE